MSTYLNEEVVNDTAKLVMHRIAARLLARDPSLVDEAWRSLDRIEGKFPDRTFVGEWRAILLKPLGEIRSLLTQRDEEMRRLRLSSPFMLVEQIDLRDPALRLRIWKLARRLAVRASQKEDQCEVRSSMAA